MQSNKIFESIKSEVTDAPRNQRTLEIHIQMIKHADSFRSMTNEEFCELADLPKSYKTEFSKMRNLIRRLRSAGLDTKKL